MARMYYARTLMRAPPPSRMVCACAHRGPRVCVYDKRATHLHNGSFPLIVRGCGGLSLARALECQRLASQSGCFLMNNITCMYGTMTQHRSVVVTNCILTPAPAFQLSFSPDPFLRTHAQLEERGWGRD